VAVFKKQETSPRQIAKIINGAVLIASPFQRMRVALGKGRTPHLHPLPLTKGRGDEAFQQSRTRSTKTYRGPLLAVPTGRNLSSELLSRGDFVYLDLGPFAGSSTSFKCCYSTDNSRFHPAYLATCTSNTAGSFACCAALASCSLSTLATYRTRKSSSLAARLTFGAARNTSCTTLRSPGLSFCSWHNSPSFQSVNFSRLSASIRSWARARK